MTSKNKTALLIAGAALGGMVVGSIGTANAQLGGLVRGGAIIILVDKFSPQINSFVNTVTGSKPGNDSGEATKVVPILSVGRGTFAGAVQVTGPSSLVDTVKAVAQIEGQTKIGTDVRVKGLIPISTRDVKDLGSIARVKGVGVSALIDVKL